MRANLFDLRMPVWNPWVGAGSEQALGELLRRGHCADPHTYDGLLLIMALQVSLNWT